MDTSFELFQFNQRYCRAIGIDSSESSKICFAFNWGNLISLLCVAQFIATLTAFLFFGAKSMHEYGMTFFVIIGLTLIVTVYINYLCEVKNCSAFIENCKKFIGKSEWKDCLSNWTFLILQIHIFIDLRQENNQRSHISNWMRKSSYFVNYFAAPFSWQCH